MQNMKAANHRTVDRIRWQRYVEDHIRGTIFHTPYMYDVYKNTPGLEPFALFAVNEKSGIQAMLAGYIQTVKFGPLSFMTKRSILMQSPISNSQESLISLLHNYHDYMKSKALYTEIRNHFDTEETREIYHELHYSYEEHLNIIVDLTLPEDELWRQVHPKRRNEIRKSIKSNVKVSALGYPEISDTYKILKEVYNRARLPLVPILFFQNAYKYNDSKTKLVAYGAKCQEELLGTMITLQYKGIVYDLYAGSLSRFYDKNPNDILPWEVFRICKNLGCTKFDFGGAGKPNIPYGVRDYKAKFGGIMVNYGRYQLIHNKPLFNAAQAGFRFLRSI